MSSSQQGVSDLSKTSLRRIEQYRDRWSSFGAHTGIEHVSEKPAPADLREFDIFQDFDDKFLEKIAPDVSIALWGPEAVLFEQGTYLDLAFFIAEGEIEVHFEGGEDWEPSQALPIFDVARTAYLTLPKTDPGTVASSAGSSNPVPSLESSVSEGTVLAALPKPEPPRPIEREATGANEITFLSTLDFHLPTEGARLGAGELLGEIGAMSGWPQSVTARTVSSCRLVQIRVPALRAMKRKSKSLKKRLDGLYRERTLHRQLKSTPLFYGLDSHYLRGLENEVELVSLDPGEVLIQEGDDADALYLVRSGFLRLSQKYGEGEMVVTYLSKGMTLGEVEIMVDTLSSFETTATSVEYSELVKLPRNVLQQTLKTHREVEERLWNGALHRLKEIGSSRRDPGRSAFVRQALDEGLVQGNSILLINLEACTRCDDCVRACADTHGGRPRFVREGDKIGHLLVAKSCYHCRDPVCLVGCPTGAIHRAGEREVVDIHDPLCIGCGTCAGNCPYDAIVMHELDETWPDDMLPSGLRGKDRRVASKCDLCQSTNHGPACVENCPQGCAFRVGSLDEIRGVLRKDD